MFAKADVLGDGVVDAEEARVAREALRRELLGARCICGERVSCFTLHVGMDGVLSEAEYGRAYLPCLLSGLSGECRAVVCALVR
jgi:hypothetical protein